MPKVVQITVAPSQTDRLIPTLRQLPGLLGLRVQRAVSIEPPGDVLTLEVTNRSLHGLVRLLREQAIGCNSASSITTSEPISVVSSPKGEAIARDASEATWEEMELVMGKESNMTGNALLVMALSGVLATVGIATDALHVVIGAMVIAPGFEPISRISLGVVANGRGWRHGLYDTGAGYLALLVAAAITAAVLQAAGTPLFGGTGAYLPAGVLSDHWSEVSPSSLLVTAAASTAGAVLIATGRSVLTSGVMIALALIPAAAMVGMALVAGEGALALKALLRWCVEAGSVLVFSGLVLGWKRLRVHRRGIML